MTKNHLNDITVNGSDTKPLLTVLLILGVSDYTRIKAKTPPKIGKPSDPGSQGIFDGSQDILLNHRTQIMKTYTT